MSKISSIDWFVNWTKDFLEKSLNGKKSKKQFYDVVDFYVETYEDSEIIEEGYAYFTQMLSEGTYDIELHINPIYNEKYNSTWDICINLGDKVAYERCEKEKAENNEWICHLQKSIFSCTARNNYLEDVLKVFKKWVEPSPDLDENVSIYEWFFHWASIFMQEKRNRQKEKGDVPKVEYTYYSVENTIDGGEEFTEVYLDEVIELCQFDIAIISNLSCDSPGWFIRLDLSNSGLDVTNIGLIPDKPCLPDDCSAIRVDLLDKESSDNSVENDNLDVALYIGKKGKTSILAQCDCEHLVDAFRAIREFIETRSEKA